MQKAVLLFPGQGSQTVGMGKDLAQEFSEYRATLEEASDVLGFNLASVCFEDPESKLNLTEFTQPALLASSIATLRTLQAHSGVQFNLVAGHSLGEYSALVSIEALSFANALKAVRFRGQAMQRAVPVGIGAMAAYLGTAGKAVCELCLELTTKKSVVEVVNYNSPGQLVLSGHKQAVEKACEHIAEKKLGRAKALPVSAPFHSSLMTRAAVEMAAFLEQIDLAPLPKGLVANVDAQIHSRNSYSKQSLVRQIASPVLWTQTLQKIYEETPESPWIEVGPGKVLQGLAKKTIETANCATTHDVASLRAVIEMFK